MIAIAWALFALMNASLGVLSSALFTLLGRLDRLARFDRLDARFDGLAARMDVIAARVDRL